jgi:hypothetical protein
MHKIKKKKKLVRMLRKAVDIVYGTGKRNISGPKPDRSELETRRLLARLEQLAYSDPNSKFDVLFAQLNVRIVRHLRSRRD